LTVFTILLVFSIGSLSGWIIELIYRTFVSQKRLVNPGFLSGPYLPLYGFGVFALYLLSIPDMSLWYRALFFFLATTILEWITGEFFLKAFNLRLWDYSTQKWNYKGLICPLFSVFWTILALGFYFFAFPPLQRLVTIAPEYVYAYLGIGFFYGIFSEDLVISFHLAARLSSAIKLEVEKNREKLEVRLKELSMEQRFVDFRVLKLQMRKKENNPGGFSSFIRYFNPFNSFLNMGKDRVNLQQSISSYMDLHWADRKGKKNKVSE